MAGWLGIPALTGIFVLEVGSVAAGTTVLWLFLQPDPLLLAREHAAAQGVDTTSRVGLQRVWSVVSARPKAAAAISAIAVAHGMMLSVRVMTPVHMNHGGATLTVIGFVIGFVISAHVFGMFAFSPLVGWLTDRLGRRRCSPRGRRCCCQRGCSSGC